MSARPLLDHVAIEIGDFDARIELLTGVAGMELRRIGRFTADPNRRIAMLADARGTKLELVEGTPGAPDRLLHVAFGTAAPDDVDAVFADLLGAGCDAQQPPARFEPARSRSATVTHASGAVYQVVSYDADSTDAADRP